MTRTAITILLAAGALGAFAAPAGAAPFGALTPEFGVSSEPGPNAAEPAVAIDDGGTATFVWTENGSTPSIKARAHPPGGPLGAAIPLSATSGAVPSEPSVAASSAGELVAWTSTAGATETIEARRRFADGTLSPILDISTGPAAGGKPRVSLDALGEGTVVWEEKTGSTWTVRARRVSHTATLSAIQTVAGPMAAEPVPQVVPLFQGTALLAWTDNGTLVRERTINTIGALGPTMDASAPGQTSFGVQVATDPSGDALFGWKHQTGATWNVQIRHQQTNGALDPIQDASPNDAWAPPLAVALSDRGVGAVGWSEKDDGGTSSYHVRLRAYDGTLGSDQQLDSSAKAMLVPPALAMDDAGRTTVAFTVDQGGVRQVRTRSVADDEAPSPLRTVATSASSPALAVAPLGDGALAWVADPAPAFLHAVGIDARPPSVSSLTVPMRAERGVPAQLSAAAVDTWSATTTSWSLGDGTEASGPVVTHAFARTGTYPVTVTARDALGSTASFTRRVTVLDTIAPRVAKLRVSPSRLKRPVKRVSLRFTLSEDARVTAVLERRAGRRWKRVGRIAGSRHAGEQKLALPARRLIRGSYRVRVAATDGSGNRSTARTLRFRVGGR